MPQLLVPQGEFKPVVASRIVFGQGKIVSLRVEIGNFGGKRALVLSGRTVAEKTSSVKTVVEALGTVT